MPFQYRYVTTSSFPDKMSKATTNVEFRKVNVEEDQFEDQAAESTAESSFESNIPVIESKLTAGDHVAALKVVVTDYPRSSPEVRAKYRNFVSEIISRIPKGEIESVLNSLAREEQENFMRFIMDVQRTPGIKASVIQSCLGFEDALMTKIQSGGLMRVIVTRQK